MSCGCGNVPCRHIVITNNDNCGDEIINVTQPLTGVVEVVAVGPQGPTGASGSSGTSGTSGISPTLSVYGLFNQTGSGVPITNTTTETTLINGGVGTLSVPANGFTKGDAFSAILTGDLNARNNDSLRIRIKTDSTILVDTGNIIMAGATNKHWELNIYFSVNEIGGPTTASLSTAGIFRYTKDASSEFQGINFNTNNSTTFDTTIDNTLEVTAQWSVARTDNSIYSQIFTLTKTY